MDFKKPENKLALDSEIKKLCHAYSNMLLNLNNTDQHKAALLFYWLREYKQLLNREKGFNPNYLKKYNRGDIINVNLGFNPGSEQGGLHYAIVLSNTPKSSETITIIPLKSKKSEDYIPRYGEIDLGSEFIDIFSEKSKSILLNFDNELELYNDLVNQKNNLANDSTTKLELAKSFYETFKNTLRNSSSEEEFEAIRKTDEPKLKEKLNEVQQSIKNLEHTNEEIKEKRQFIEETSNLAKAHMAHLNTLNSGSIALVNQITTISKMRIINPIRSKDTLSKIKLSPQTLDLIDKEILKLFTYQKSKN